MSPSNLQQELLKKMNAFDAAIITGASQLELHSIYKEIKTLNHEITINKNPCLWYALKRVVQGRGNSGQEALRTS